MALVSAFVRRFPLPCHWLALLSVGALLGACHPEPKAEQATPSPPAAAPPPPAVASPYVVQHPAWAARATLYEVNVRQYTPEGTLNAFRRHLPRLQRMGVRILWLMPIHPIGREHRKGSLGSYYSVRDYRAVNPELGTMQDLRGLVNEAHQRGMYVILDWVANHSAWDNPLVKEHPDWYTRDAAGQLQPPVADWQDVVDFDYGKPGLRRYMLDALKYWVQEANVDGYRCDVAGLVPTDFWDTARAELENLKPVFLLAEWDELHHPPFVKEFTSQTHLLERAFDATYALRLHYRLDSVARSQLPTSSIDEYLATERRFYPPGTYLMNFTSSHDVNTWSGTEYDRLGSNALPMAVLTHLLPGIPMVYSGQEAALKKRLSFFDRDPIAWNGFPLEDFYTRLITLKLRHPALTTGDTTAHMRRVPSPAGTYAFVRQNGKFRVLAALNFSDKPVTLPLTAPLAGIWRDLFSEATRDVTSADTLTLRPHAYRVLSQ